MDFDDFKRAVMDPNVTDEQVGEHFKELADVDIDPEEAQELGELMETYRQKLFNRMQCDAL